MCVTLYIFHLVAKSQPISISSQRKSFFQTAANAVQCSQCNVTHLGENAIYPLPHT